MFKSLSLFIFIFGAMCSLNAQNLNLVQYKLSDKLSNHYERLVKHKLSEYFDGAAFLVDTRVYYDETLVPSQYKKLASRLNPDIEMLPGLPTMPSELQPVNDMSNTWGDSLVASEYKKKAEVKFIDFTILVDSTFTVAEVDFVMEMVRMVADLDETRGDRIQILKKAFPNRSEMTSMASETVETSPVVSQADDAVSHYDSNDGLRPFEWVLLILILIGFAFLIWVLSKLFSLHSGESNLKAIKAMRKEFSKEPKADETSALMAVPVSAEQSPSQIAQYTELRTFLVNQLIGQPDQSGRVLTSWIQVQEAEGIRRCAIVLNLVDPKVVTFLKNHLPEKHLIQIEMSLFSIENIETEEELELLKEFKKDFQNGTVSKRGASSQSDLFSFINQMTTNQVKHLVNEENPGIKGLVLAQMKPAKAAEILKSFDDSSRAKVMIQMGQIQNLTVKTYKEIAERLSQKALSISNMKYVAADGVETLISVILGLPSGSQSGYISEIAEQDLELASRINQTFVLFENMPTVPAPQLLMLLDGFTKEKLALALMKTEESFVKSVVQVFPDRARDSILSIMEGNLDKSLDEVELARRELLTHIHIELTKMGGLKI